VNTNTTPQIKRKPMVKDRKELKLLLRMERSMMANGSKLRKPDRAEGRLSGRTAPCMKATGWIAKLMVKVD
jgi:hypothetical protein